MLSIRMQRTGRKGHAQYRVVVQDSRRTPTSGVFVAQLGHYNPHTKEAVINTEKAAFYLKNGAQPSDRVVRLFQAQQVDLPKWVKTPASLTRGTRNPEKLRKNQPAEESTPVTEPVTESTPGEEAAEPAKDVAEDEKPAEDTAA